jgi:hypothetical protein
MLQAFVAVAFVKQPAYMHYNTYRPETAMFKCKDFRLITWDSCFRDYNRLVFNVLGRQWWLPRSEAGTREENK